jgi:hypothetical protein
MLYDIVHDTLKSRMRLELPNQELIVALQFTGGPASLEVEKNVGNKGQVFQSKWDKLCAAEDRQCMMVHNP